MKKLKLLLLVALFALAFSLTSCDLINSVLPQPDDTDGDELLDFGDWENWGVDDWASGAFEDYDPSKNYNQIDWSKDYPGLKSETVYDLSSNMKFMASKHVQVYQAENAVLTGKANTAEGGDYVGSLDNSTVTFSINAEEECDVLLICNFAVTKSSTTGYHFNEVFNLKHNGETVDSYDCWLLPTLSWTVFKENCIAELHLTKGVNTIMFSSAIGRTNFDYIKLVPKGELSTEVLENIPTTYEFTVKDNDPFAAENGGSVVDNITTDSLIPAKETHATFGTYYEATYGASFIVNLYVDEATAVDFYFVLNNTKADFTIAETFDTIKVNGVDVTSTARVNTSVPKTASWKEADARAVLVATLTLNKGMNEITFVRNADSNSEGFNNLNIRGIKVVSSVPVSIPAHTFSLPDSDPFAAENGGYTDVPSSDLVINNSKFGTFYQNTYGKTFTFTIFAQKDTTVDFYIHLSHAKVATDVLSTIDKLIVNGTDVTDSLINTAIPNTGDWSLANSVFTYIAQLELKEGLNEITFIRKTEVSDANNLNIRGIKLVSDIPVSLAKD